MDRWDFDGLPKRVLHPDYERMPFANMVVLVVLVLLVADSARPAFEAGESRGGEERRPLTGYFYFSARRTHTDDC